MGSPRPAADTPRGELVPLAWLDHFCMRNFTNAAIFDDTLPRADGVIEAGFHVPAEALAEAMQAWFRRKGWLRPDECLLVTEKSREGLSRAKPTAE
ncbi:hypothetical protein D1Y84_04895 [Acidipila sp. EB88]|nr:hypothetical protein D1Y84_04895 [Acidipila sp. EB88]